MENSEKLLNDILDKSLEIAKISYDQEMERYKQLLSKSDFLIKYVSAILVIINGILALIVNNNDKLKIGFIYLLISYIVVSVPFLVSLIYAVLSQFIKKAEFFPSGNTMMSEIKNNINQINSMYKIKSYHLKCYGQSTEVLEEGNNDRASKLDTAYICFTASFILFCIMIAILILFIRGC